jgi:hypothetical protein
MTRRNVIVGYAHAGLALALVFMILEVEHIGKLWGPKMSHEFLVTGYCLLLVGTILSVFAAFKTLWAWVLTATVLFFYGGFAVPEGVEDVRCICADLMGRPEQWGLLLLRLAFTLFLAVPLVLFLILAVFDVCAFRGRAKALSEETKE